MNRLMEAAKTCNLCVTSTLGSNEVADQDRAFISIHKLGGNWEVRRKKACDGHPDS